MDYHQHALLRCVLKVHRGCEACKRQTMEVLGSLVGVYDFTIDAENRTAKIIGQVDPNYCIKALGRCGPHAELIWANLSHPKIPRGLYPYDYGSSYYNYHKEPYSHRRSLPEGMWHEYPMTNALPEYSYNTNYYYDESRHVPSYPPRVQYSPYFAEESMNFCSIM